MGVACTRRLLLMDGSGEGPLAYAYLGHWASDTNAVCGHTGRWDRARLHNASFSDLRDIHSQKLINYF